MKRLFLVLFLISTLSNAQYYTVMTYNIKLDYPKDGKHSWENRKLFFMNQLKFHEPDIFSVQEAMPNQMKDIDRLLPNYSFVGVGRDDGKGEGEFSAIFYKKDKFKILRSSTFWLSQTPNKVSMGWDAVCNRVCTYALFENQKTKQQFYVFNTHFDHVGVEARKNSAVLIIEKITELNQKNDPVILTGDFNMEPDHESILYIKKTLKDSKHTASINFGPEGTYNGFHFDKPVISRIDYVFVSENVEVTKYAVLSDNWNLQYPSDHLPVFVELNFKSN
ncbi:endonuclease/exonuclease/phosphatase family protein [Flavivirga sp. 57AJ16]|uniref:endonuclease/exonuclease/phosphatase family protein n=1 Tax=Flavivirga sp. 57AJ16 TaxID=3025307 RepID=UPI0023665929|nr:endonuclease/exonuclease/phosphatase family protein [Flavivirga sp. 57AJ16]MDD7887530.1 endonuclease/exonuclease/phosphatase family protein [Flavivirga sp. 57AJ16]